MHYHTVLFQFDGSTTPETIDDVLRHLRGLADVPAVRGIAVGENKVAATDGWSHGMTLVFDDFDAMRNDFGNHPLHLAVLRDQLPLFSRYMAMDVDDLPG